MATQKSSVFRLTCKKTRMKKLSNYCPMLLLALVVPLLSSCGSAVKKAEKSINAESLLSEIKTLSSDDFEGRKPGSPGKKKTVGWIEQQFRQMGLKPGNPDGTYIQKVPLAGVTSKDVTEISVKGKKLALDAQKDYYRAVEPLRAERGREQSTDIVFVGYGVVAPEYGWDDYRASTSEERRF